MESENTTARIANSALIDQRIEQGLDLLRQHYDVIERPLDEVFRCMDIGGRPHEPACFDIAGVGNLLTMTVKDSDTAQLSSFVITPYFKNLPLFSTDYVYQGNTRFFLIELYNLGNAEDAAFSALVDALQQKAGTWTAMPDKPVRACWYDDIRPLCVCKAPDAALDQEAIEGFLECLQLFIDAERRMPLLNDDARRAKWQATKAYSDGLIDEGGVSTDLFTAAIGAENTRRYFDEVFFAPQRYRLA